MTSYDPRGHTWESWCSLMNELFAPQQLGVVTEDKWREWGDGMAGNGYFMNSNIPDSRSFAEWKDWAASLVGIMSIQP